VVVDVFGLLDVVEWVGVDLVFGVVCDG